VVPLAAVLVTPTAPPWLAATARTWAADGDCCDTTPDLATVFHAVVREHLETFLAETRGSGHDGIAWNASTRRDGGRWQSLCPLSTAA